ncbi:hypothetical protein KFL_016690010 [Klebsormidium nitens]|uniref:RNase H type-1 domain-containing protein n=1 Tax=Klebsormidium nitens TaxID=105231 RepID=A0A1Y1IXD7_KLENI|nr:hypothetical protein KFL_016690010 [Klebsormidium nitens]|eukprot:GAQ93576.1 hypothetical protein KFL_016690010 [Klebsormidium nitens]
MRFYEVAEAETWDVAKKMDEHDFHLELPHDVKEVKAESKEKAGKKKKNSFGFRQFRNGKKGGFSKGFGGYQQQFGQGGFQQSGSVSGLFTRYLHRALNTRSPWRSSVSLDASALSELSFWTSFLEQFSARPIWQQFSLVLVLQYDAGAHGWGGHVIIDGHRHFAHGFWAPDEVHGRRSSTWRELQGLHRLLLSVGHLLSGHRVIARGDAQNVFWILDKGGSRLEHLQEICLDIFWLCYKQQIDLTPDWVPRTQNELADYLSKLVDYDDFGLQPAAFSRLVQQLGAVDIDCFASEHNALLPAFFSELWTPRARAANAFAQSWSGSRCYCFPPPKLIPRVLQHALECRSDIVLVVLDWPSQFWWPLLRSGSAWAPFVCRSVRLPM